MPHRLPHPARPARTALVAVKVTVVGSIAVAGWATQTAGDAPAGGYAGYAVDDQPSRVDKVLDRHDCSITGFDSAQPLSAIVRSASGRLRFVPFDTGWQVFTRDGAAELVAVCLDEAPARAVRPASGRAVTPFARREPLGALERATPERDEAVAQLVRHRLGLGESLLLQE
jgi:hypothetical protein